MCLTIYHQLTYSNLDIWCLFIWLCSSIENYYQYFKGFLSFSNLEAIHDGIMTWKRFSQYRSFVRGIHRSQKDSPHKGPVVRSFNFPLMSALTNCWIKTVEGQVKWNVLMLMWRLCNAYCFVLRFTPQVGIVERGVVMWTTNTCVAKRNECQNMLVMLYPTFHLFWCTGHLITHFSGTEKLTLKSNI